MKNIAIIYCPNHRPYSTAAKRWAEIAACLDASGIQYDMVQSENAQSVPRLFMMMVDNGYKTIVIAGGDSALNDAVNCLMGVDREVRESIRLGVIPNGTINDFAAYWGFYYKTVQDSVDALKQCRERKIDVGCLRYTDKDGERRKRYFLNCVNVGLLARIQMLRKQMRRRLWSRKLSFALSLILMFFYRTDHRMEYSIYGVKETHHVMTMCVGSAWGYGQTPSAKPYSGRLDITVIKRNVWLQMVEAVMLYIKGKILNHDRLLVYRTQEITIDAPKNIPITVDGRKEDSPRGEFNIEIIPEQINFIIESIRG